MAQNIKNRCTNCDCKVVSKCLKPHPVLKTSLCDQCYRLYMIVGDLSQYRGGVDIQGSDNYCRWCLDGGDLLLCADETCRNGFCRNCIVRNFSEEAARRINDDANWYCFVCNYSQIDDDRVKKVKIKLPRLSKPMSEPPSTPLSKPTSEPPSTPLSKPTTEPMSTPPSKPISEPPSTPVSTPLSKPTSEPMSTTPSKPISEPPSTPFSKPTSEPMSTSPSKPISEPPSTPVSTPLSKPTSEPMSTTPNPISEPPSERLSEPLSEPTSKPVSKPASKTISAPQTTAPPTLPAGNTEDKTKFPTGFKVYSTSNLFGCAQSSPAKVDDDTSELNGIDLDALEDELALSDSDSTDYKEASENLPMTNDPSADSGDVTMTNVEPDKTEHPITRDTTMKDLEIIEALEAHTSEIEDQVKKSQDEILTWALRDANVIKERLDILVDSLQKSLKNFNQNQFIANPMDLISWTNRVSMTLEQSPHLIGRCSHVDNYLSYFEERYGNKKDT